jgi:hypothetical protein
MSVMSVIFLQFHLSFALLMGCIERNKNNIRQKSSVLISVSQMVVEAGPRGPRHYLILLFSSNEKACEMSERISSQRRGTGLKSKMT